MRFDGNGEASVNYEPNSFGGPTRIPDSPSARSSSLAPSLATIIVRTATTTRSREFVPVAAGGREGAADREHRGQLERSASAHPGVASAALLQGRSGVWVAAWRKVWAWTSMPWWRRNTPRLRIEWANADFRESRQQQLANWKRGGLRGLPCFFLTSGNCAPLLQAHLGGILRVFGVFERPDLFGCRFPGGAVAVLTFKAFNPGE